MKTFGMLPVVALVLSGWITSYGQEMEPEVPGDHFSLEGALELFKQSESPEQFEKMLNSPDSKVNNLDLNGDGYIDYIRVLDRYEGNVHAFILQAVISEREFQDVAVIELEKLANGKAVLQIIGDEDVYGVETIIEPTREARTYAGTTTNRTIVNVWAWPSVQYVYGPYYAGWVSPWAWHVHPIWWRPWRPVAYVHYHTYWRPYHPYYSAWHTHRVVYAHRIYHPHRTTSVYVRDRHHDQITRYRSSRENEYRSGRTGNDAGRSSARDGRSSLSTGDVQQRSREDSYVNRRPSTGRETVATPSRSPARQRSVPGTTQRNETEVKRDDSQNRRSYTVPDNRAVRREVNSPAVNRTRSYESPNVQQHSKTREQVRTNEVQRNTPAQRSYEAHNRSSGTVQNNRAVRQQATSPSVNRTSPSVNRSSPSVNRSRSSGGNAVQQRSSSRSDGIKYSGTKRGRE